MIRKTHTCLSFLFISVILFFNKAATAKDANSPFPNIKIPVRLNVFAGLQKGTSSYYSDKKDIAALSYLAGIDFNVPIPQISSLVGINAWYMAPVKSGNTSSSSFFLVGPYLGYARGSYDVFVGGGFSILASTLTDSDAGTNTSVNLYKTTGCGIAGLRHYMGKSQSTGFGLTGYACQASDYYKVLNSSSQDKTSITDKATASGGILYIFYAWGEDRTLI